MYNRPTITIGNVTALLADSLLLGQGFEDLIGKRIRRRITLEEYLGIASSVEYPQTLFIIDRIKEKTAIAVTLELAAPFDLQGIKLPFRVVLKDTCPWRYKEGADTPESSGCNWCKDFHTTDTTYSYDSTDIFVNRNNEYIVLNISATDWATSPTTVVDSYYYTTGNVEKKVNSDGTISTVSINKYWQAKTAAAVDTPSEDSLEWRLVQNMVTYSSSIDIDKYVDSRFSTYVLYNNDVWQARTVSLDADDHISAPFGGSRYWSRGDQCGKTIQSCKKRFHAAPLNHGASTVNMSSKLWLPFGGFPGSRKF